MAGYVIAGAQAAGAVTQTVVGMADAAAHIQDVTRQMAAKTKEDMRDEANEFNIRNQFLSNAVQAIKEATFSQFNIVICTDQEHDDFQDLQGQILPMDLLNLEISTGKFVNFQVYVFDTGKYLRHGKYEPNYWQFWGNTQKFYDPVAMHVHFDNAQKKRDANAIKAQQDQKAKEDKIAADAAASAKTVQTTAAANDAPELKIEAERKAAEAKANANQQPGEVTDVDGGVSPAVGDGASSDAAASGGATGAITSSMRTGPAPSFMSHMAGIAAGPAMKLLMG